MALSSVISLNLLVARYNSYFALSIHSYNWESSVQLGFKALEPLIFNYITPFIAYLILFYSKGTYFIQDMEDELWKWI